MTGLFSQLRDLKQDDLLRQSVPGAVVAVAAVLFAASPELLERLAQEDYIVEWLTFGFFAAAGLLFSQEARRLGFFRAWIVTAAAIFCFGVAGEEISWGQRLFGFLPPRIFLENNFQQESNLHNLLQPFIKPKWLVVFTLAVWGAVLPAIRAFSSGRRLPLPQHTEAMTLPLSFTPWALIGAALLVVYPADFTGEYIELLTGALFYLAACGQSTQGGRRRAALAALPLFIAASGFGFTELRAGLGGEQKVSCARNEVQALARAICKGEAAERLLDTDSFHKRLFTAMRSGHISSGAAKILESVSCPGVRQDPDRRRYLMDPWGQPYWIRYQDVPERESDTALVYSFGPNRRRDCDTDDFSGTDDIGARTPPIDADDPEAGGQAVRE